jgi:hypothetical protein
MSKKVAKLVTFCITTRVIVNESDKRESKWDWEEEDAEAIKKAIPEILSDAANYVIGDNVSEIWDDDECPYGTLKTDNDDNNN